MVPLPPPSSLPPSHLTRSLQTQSHVVLWKRQYSVFVCKCVAVLIMGLHGTVKGGRGGRGGEGGGGREVKMSTKE